jgi:hypothetical protein
VRDGEALHGDVAQNPAGTGLELLHGRRLWLPICVEAFPFAFPFQERRCEARYIYGNGFVLPDTPADQAREPGDVVRMFMRDENGVQIFGFFADCRQPPREFSYA